MWHERGEKTDLQQILYYLRKCMNLCMLGSKSSEWDVQHREVWASRNKWIYHENMGDAPQVPQGGVESVLSYSAVPKHC